jgi:hypothetical protein
MPNRPRCPECDGRLLLVQVLPINDVVNIIKFESVNATTLRKSRRWKSLGHLMVG